MKWFLMVRCVLAFGFTIAFIVWVYIIYMRAWKGYIMHNGQTLKKGETLKWEKHHQ